MVLKLYGYYKDTCSRRVAIVLHEKNVPFEFINVDIAKGEQKDPKYLRYQPFGVTPYIDDDGFILYESRAITLYIAEKYRDQGTPLMPNYSDLKAFALFQQACYTEIASFSEYVEKIVYEKVIKLLRGDGVTDEDHYESLLLKLEVKLQVYDTILSKQKYLAGDSITLADLSHIPYGSMLPAAGTNIMESKPNVKRWWNDITSRPSWIAFKDGITNDIPLVLKA